MLALLKILIKGIQVIGLLIAVLVLNACSDREKNSSLIFREINWSLENSNMRIGYSTDKAIRDLEDQTKRPETADKAMLLLSKAKYIQSKAIVVIKFIDSLRKVLDVNMSANSYTENLGKDFANSLFTNQKMGKELYNKLINSRTAFLSIDSNYAQEFEQKLVNIANQNFMGLYKDDEQFTKVFFRNKVYDEVVTNLSKFKNDILITENGIIDFLRYRITNELIIYDYFPKLLTTQNSTHFKLGEELVIKTGIGAYDVISNQRIKIKGLNIDSEDGLSIYKMKVENKPGKYKVPIEIVFTNFDGKQEVYSENVEYTVDE